MKLHTSAIHFFALYKLANELGYENQLKNAIKGKLEKLFTTAEYEEFTGLYDDDDLNTSVSKLVEALKQEYGTRLGEAVKSYVSKINTSPKRADIFKTYDNLLDLSDSLTVRSAPSESSGGREEAEEETVSGTDSRSIEANYFKSIGKSINALLDNAKVSLKDDSGNVIYKTHVVNGKDEYIVSPDGSLIPEITDEFSFADTISIAGKPASDYQIGKSLFLTAKEFTKSDDGAKDLLSNTIKYYLEQYAKPDDTAYRFSKGDSGAKDKTQAYNILKSHIKKSRGPSYVRDITKTVFTDEMEEYGDLKFKKERVDRGEKDKRGNPLVWTERNKQRFRSLEKAIKDKGLVPENIPAKPGTKYTALKTPSVEDVFGGEDSQGGESEGGYSSVSLDTIDSGLPSITGKVSLNSIEMESIDSDDQLKRFVKDMVGRVRSELDTPDQIAMFDTVLSVDGAGFFGDSSSNMNASREFFDTLLKQTGVSDIMGRINFGNLHDIGKCLKPNVTSDKYCDKCQKINEIAGRYYKILGIDKDGNVDARAKSNTQSALREKLLNKIKRAFDKLSPAAKSTIEAVYYGGKELIQSIKKKQEASNSNKQDKLFSSKLTEYQNLKNREIENEAKRKAIREKMEADPFFFEEEEVTGLDAEVEKYKDLLFKKEKEKDSDTKDSSLRVKITRLKDLLKTKYNLSDQQIVDLKPEESTRAIPLSAEESRKLEKLEFEVKYEELYRKLKYLKNAPGVRRMTKYESQIYESLEKQLRRLKDDPSDVTNMPYKVHEEGPVKNYSYHLWLYENEDVKPGSAMERAIARSRDTCEKYLRESAKADTTEIGRIMDSIPMERPSYSLIRDLNKKDSELRSVLLEQSREKTPTSAPSMKEQTELESTEPASKYTMDDVTKGALNKAVTESLSKMMDGFIKKTATKPSEEKRLLFLLLKNYLLSRSGQGTESALKKDVGDLWNKQVPAMDQLLGRVFDASGVSKDSQGLYYSYLLSELGDDLDQRIKKLVRTSAINKIAHRLSLALKISNLFA